MQILKFGGTSVANAENMKKVVEIVLGVLRTRFLASMHFCSRTGSSIFKRSLSF